MNKKFLPLFLLFFCLEGCTSLLGNDFTGNTKKSSLNRFSLFSPDDDEENSVEPKNTPEQDIQKAPTRLRRNNAQKAFSEQQINSPRRPFYLSGVTLNLKHIDGNIWRTSANPNVIFNIMTRIILQNYIVSTLDKKNLSLQTDWDKFFIQGRLFRNRVNVTVYPISQKQTEITIKNIVEYYTGTQEGRTSKDAEVWLPSPDITDEVQKIVSQTNKQTNYAYSQSSQRER